MVTTYQCAIHLWKLTWGTKTHCWHWNYLWSIFGLLSFPPLISVDQIQYISNQYKDRHCKRYHFQEYSNKMWWVYRKISSRYLLHIQCYTTLLFAKIIVKSWHIAFEISMRNVHDRLNEIGWSRPTKCPNQPIKYIWKNSDIKQYINILTW